MEAVSVLCDLVKSYLNVVPSESISRAAERLRDKKVVFSLRFCKMCFCLSKVWHSLYLSLSFVLFNLQFRFLSEERPCKSCSNYTRTIAQGVLQALLHSMTI